MSTQQLPYVILMADDDADDRLMAQEAFEEAQIRNPLYFVEDGQQLVDYLQWQNGYTPANAPRPGLILLDLNMPRKGGTTVLAEIKADSELKIIPVVVFTTSGAKADIRDTYELGASGYVKKPATFSGLVNALQAVHEYWAELVESPVPSGPHPNTPV